MITAWSHSRLSIFESCKYRAYLAYVERIPEPDRGDPREKIGKPEWPNDRGSRVHDEAENFVRGKTKKLIKELAKFKVHFERLRDLFNEGKVVLEDMWCYDINWKPVGPRAFDKIWVRIKLDAMVFLSDSEGVVIDYKTGKRYGNEIKHAEQCQLYAVGAFLKYPKLQKVTTELWYTDLDEMSTMKFTRAQAMRFLKNFNTRGLKITTCTEFPLTATQHTCKWCPYGPAGTNDCPEGIQ